jgi:hypothetical protein
MAGRACGGAGLKAKMGQTIVRTDMSGRGAVSGRSKPAILREALRRVRRLSQVVVNTEFACTRLARNEDVAPDGA